MALAALAIGGALLTRANNKRSRQIEDVEDRAAQPENQQQPGEEQLYDPLRRGPRWATNWLANRALHMRKRWPQPYARPVHENGQQRIMVRAVVGPETAARMQHTYAESLREAPPFFYCKTVSVNRQIQPFRMPSYHAGLTQVDQAEYEFNKYPMVRTSLHCFANRPVSAV